MEPDKKQDPLKFTRPRKYLEPPDSFSIALYKNIVAVLEKADKKDLAPETLKALDELKKYIQDCESLVDKYPKDEDLKKAQEILKTLPSNFAKQGELFSYFTPPSSVNIKRDVVVSWVSTKKIKEKYPHLLDLTLAGDNKTLSQLLDEVENWYKTLRGEDYGNWIKVFLFARAVKDQLINEPDTVDLFEDKSGKYNFIINVDKRFYEFFEKPIGNKPNGIKYHTDNQKKKIIAWLEKNNGAVEFPIIASLPNKREAIIPKAGKVFSFTKAIRDDGKQLLMFSIDTNVLDDDFKNYVSFSREDIDAIEEAWKTKNPKYEEESLKEYVDIPLRFFSILKLLYSREAVKILKKGLRVCIQEKTGENLDSELGNLTDRIQKHLKSRNIIRTGKKSDKPQEVKKLILETTFKIAKERGWLFCMPGYNGKKYKFTMNPGFFDKRETAKQLQGAKSVDQIADIG